MRAARFHEHGGPEVLTVDEVDDPDPDHGQVLVDVEAAAVNPVDTYFREGEYPVPHLPFVGGSDVAGTVAAVGDGVEHFAVGDRVFGTGLGNGMPGSYAERVAAPADFLAHLPEGVAFDDAAALALVGTTAWQGLVHHAAAEPAETVLVHGGSGGVGHVAIQLAETMGARVHATASPDHADELESLGADAVFDYAREDLADAVVDAGGADVIVDLHMDQYLQFNADVANAGARVIGIGNDTSSGGFTDIGVTKGKEVRYQFMSMYNADDIGAVLARLADLAVRDEIAPVIHETYGLGEIGEAQRAVLEDSFVGKLVVTP
ncbi:NADPH:quinone reductase [Halobellus limi]|uniref:NADPH2:quinone reductase n=1 Tax=Halobellus limi TaxID=699433 RepID=A0A1H5UV63_9EURY|nr:NADPH:quinone reductase [Halobellus limi]QCC46931.1 NADPH:quinone reductase [Halobellus limi]SEF78107.1 NADPH2:quinone reductase [Halobellus limi]